MNKFWFIEKDFYAARSNRIGASDVPALIVNPEKPTESLAAWERTPLTVWQEKTGRKERDPAGIPAEMGHWNEPKAIEFFLRDLVGFDKAKEIIKKKIVYELDKEKLHAINFQDVNFFHNAQFFDESKICHPDMIYNPIDPMPAGKVDGIEIDTSKPFLIEAKSSNFWSAKRKEGSLITGYDFDLRTWQGIPLKHYMQIQFQLSLLDISVGYLALLYDTSNFQVWEIKQNKKHQNQINEIVDRMAWHIKNDVEPKDLAINRQDIINLYPTVNDDFQIVTGEEYEKVVGLCKDYRTAADQLKKWEEKKQEISDAIAVHLKDSKEIRGFDTTLAAWTIRKGYEKVKSLSEISKNYPKIYKYLVKNDMVEKTADSRSVSVKWKEI